MRQKPVDNLPLPGYIYENGTGLTSEWPPKIFRPSGRMSVIRIAPEEREK